MKQALRQKQKLSLNITANLGNQIKLLSLSGFEISSKLNELINDYFDEEDKKLAYFKDEYKIDLYKNILFEERGFIGSFSENEDKSFSINKTWDKCLKNNKLKGFNFATKVLHLGTEAALKEYISNEKKI